jgi:hypothetical protein
MMAQHSFKQRSNVLIAFKEQLDKSRDLKRADGDGSAGSSQEEEEDPPPDS